MKKWPSFANKGPILLDFDGPICSVFAGYPAPRVAHDLRSALSSRGIKMTEDLLGISDPLAVLRWTSENHPEATDEVDAVLTAAERTAIRTAYPTPHAHRAIVAARHVGCPIAIVSNNSLPAIADYLERHGISGDVATIAARPFGKPSQMKPNPILVKQAVHHLRATPEKCVFIGDAVTDIEAGRAAGVRVVGYAKTPRHRAALAAIDPDDLIDSMSELADSLRS